MVLLVAESLRTGKADFDDVITLLEVMFKAGTTEGETSPDGRWESLLCDG